MIVLCSLHLRDDGEVVRRSFRKEVMRFYYCFYTAPVPVLRCMKVHTPGRKPSGGPFFLTRSHSISPIPSFLSHHSMLFDIKVKFISFLHTCHSEQLPSRSPGQERRATHRLATRELTPRKSNMCQQVRRLTPMRRSMKVGTSSSLHIESV